jgi:hypothetical protein
VIVFSEFCVFHHDGFLDLVFLCLFNWFFIACFIVW